MQIAPYIGSIFTHLDWLGFQILTGWQLLCNGEFPDISLNGSL